MAAALKEAAAAERKILEDTLCQHIVWTGLPVPEREYRFHATRAYRFDLAYPLLKLAVELEGGIHLGPVGGHSSAAGITRDIIKGNLAVEEGWAVLRFTASQITTGEALTVLERVLEQRMGRSGE